MANPLYDELFGIYSGKSTVFLQLPNGETVTHQDFLTLSAQYAHALNELGLTVGDRLAVQIAKSHYSLAIYAACVQAGIVFLPLNTDYTAHEVAYFIENSGARLVIGDDKYSSALSPHVKAANSTFETLNADGSGSFAFKAQAMPVSYETVERSADDLAALLYTSGTTGRSKGAMLTQENLLSNAKTLVEHWQFTSDDVLLHALPIFHTHGLFVAINVSLLAGNKIIFLPKFDLDRLIELMPQASTMMGVPTFYTRLLGDGRFKRPLASHMRLFISGSAPLLAETHVAFENRVGHRILERYGMTETNMNTSNPYDGERRAGTVGVSSAGRRTQNH